MIGDLQATGGMFHQPQTEQKLPGKLLLQRQVNECEGRVARLARRCSLTIRYGGCIGEEINHGETHGFHNTFERASGEALE
jgi:hypothetical protein